MSKLFLLGAGTEYDTGKQAVEKNRIIQMNGYENDRYVVYDTVSSRWGLSYKLINLRTKRFGECDTFEVTSLNRPIYILFYRYGLTYYE
jgi:hypothetical protein